MNKIEKRHLAAAKRARKRKGLKPKVPLVEVVHQKEKLPESAIPSSEYIFEEESGHQDVSVSEDLDADVSQKRSSKKRGDKKKEHIQKEKQDAEEV